MRADRDRKRGTSLKKPVKIAAAAVLIAVCAFFYLRTPGGQKLLGQNKGTGEGLSFEAADDIVGKETTENGTAGDGTETEVSETAGGETVIADDGFSEQQKQQLMEIISSCLAENIGTMISDGRLASAIGKYTEVQSGLININTADKEKLTELNGIGPAKAEAIIKYREEHGGFSSVDELTEVPGISTGTLEKLREQVTL